MASSLPGVGTISDLTSQAGGGINGSTSGTTSSSTSTLGDVAGGGGPTGTNPNTPTSSGTTPNAGNPNAPGAAGGSGSDAMQQLVNMRIGQSPSLKIGQQDAAARLMGAGVKNSYTPTGTMVGGGSNPNGDVQQLINDAKGWLGVPYQYGGTSRSGVDCSGYTQAVYAQMGINIGRDTSAQFRSGQAVGQDGNWQASVSQLQPGDLIFYGQPGATGPNAHVVMYIGGGQVIQAAHTGTNVAIGSLFSSASSDEPFLGVRRYITQQSPASSGNAFIGALNANGSNPALGQKEFADALLNMLGDKVTVADERSLMNWENREGGMWHNSARYNPLNTTQNYAGASSMNGVGVKAYQSWLDGLTATTNTLRNGRYNDILRALQGGGGLSGYLPGLGAWSGGGYYSL